MTAPVIPLLPPDEAAFAPFGRFITPPAVPGKRAFYSEFLHARPPSAAPVLHVNHVEPSALPLEVSWLERHPHAAQCFMPLDVSRYVVLVMPSDVKGLPLPEQARGFLVPGNMGVIFAPDVWHLGATVLDRPGHFTVLMWRGGQEQDDEFRAIAPLSLTLPAAASHALRAATEVSP
jgi:ureidoglycolate lyase